MTCVSLRLRILATLLACAALSSVQAAEGLSGATVPPDAARPGERARFAEWCKANPEQCRELEARRKARAEQCKTDPQKCKAEAQARREQWCKDNPEKCRERQEKMKARQEQCKADPEKCRAEAKARQDERFKRADANGDGKLTREEAQKGMPFVARHFDELDANRDGFLTREELDAAHKARAARRAEKSAPRP